MEAIILAGGFGTRLRPLTYTRAKPLLPILNKPMIGHIIDSLPKEIDKIILAVNYRKDQIEQYFKENDYGRTIIVNDEPEPLGTGGAVKFAEKHITDKFLVLNSDIICSLDLDQMISFHKQKNAVTTISLWPVENVEEFGVVDLIEKGKIIGFVEKPRPEEAPSNLINAGAYLLEPEILDYIEKGKLVSMEKEIFPQIINDTHRFYGYEFKGYWMDIGRISSYLEVNRFLIEKEKLKNIIGRNCVINGEANNTSIGNNVEIGENTLLESSIVFDNAIIKENSKIKNSIIGEKSIIQSDTHLQDTVIGDNETVDEKQNIKNKIIWTQEKPKGYPDKQIGNALSK